MGAAEAISDNLIKFFSALRIYVIGRKVKLGSGLVGLASHTAIVRAPQPITVGCGKARRVVFPGASSRHNEEVIACGGF